MLLRVLPGPPLLRHQRHVVHEERGEEAAILPALELDLYGLPCESTHVETLVLESSGSVPVREVRQVRKDLPGRAQHLYVELVELLRFEFLRRDIEPER